jgi:leader peptidase (prepilin peptidase)/N-methyltransferase
VTVPAFVIWIYAFVIGAMIGSFLNVCIYRWPAGQSVIRPRSRCPSCGHQLTWRENIPIFSWLLQGGRCRNCRTAISVQYPLIELTVALIWTAAAIRFGVTVAGLSSAAFLTIMLGIAVTDAREMVIPDQFTWPGTAIGLALAAFPGGITLLSSFLGAAGSALAFWLLKLAAEKALKKPALGTGDIFMMAVVGAFLGPAGAVLTVMLGSLLGLIVGVPIMFSRGKLERMATYLPLGTFLALGAAIAHGWGTQLIDWYIGFVLG